MAFPATRLNLTVELFINGAWTDITNLVYMRNDQVITRGRPNENATIDRSLFSGIVNNRSGNLSPRNPTGIYYGQIGRNTRCRVRLSPAPEAYLRTNQDMSFSGAATTPDSVNLSITGDIDVRIDIRPDAWGMLSGLCHKYLSTGNQRSWAFWLNADNTLSFRWSPDGTLTNAITKTSTAAITPPTLGRLAVRVTLTVNNGAAGNDVKFYTAPDITSSFTQLGATVTTAGTTSIFDSTTEVGIGGINSAVTRNIVGRVYAFKLFQGIAGTIRADVDLDTVEAGAATFTDAQSNVWTIIQDGSVVTPLVRFNGEVSEWPQRWDLSGRDVYVPIEASGILRRLGQGAALKSTLYRGITSLATPARAYWPCEDGEGATQIASAVGGSPMAVVGTKAFAQFTGFQCSEPLPLAKTAEWKGNVPAYTSTGIVQVFFLLQVPTTGGSATNGQAIASIYTTGTTARWDVIYNAGDLQLKAFDAAGTAVLDTGNLGFSIAGKLIRVSVHMQQVSLNILWGVDTLQVGAVVVGGTGGTLNTNTMGRCTRVTINPGADLGDLVVGHISVHDQLILLANLFSELNAYIGEAAGQRIKRLCGEEGISFRAVGPLNNTAPLGAQLPAELTTLLQDAADADTGILYEPRDLFGLAYRTRESLYNQTPVLALDYALQHLAGVEPTDDDQQIRNDVTASRVDGSSARFTQDTGTLSVLPPPNGVGRYDEQVTVNVQADSQLADVAGWLVHLGTVDEARYPVLALNLAHPKYSGDAALTNAAEDLDIGDRLVVDHPPSWLPPDDITQLAQGMVETMNVKTHRVDVNCSPETPWGQAAVYDAAASRYSSDGSTLGSGVNSSATSLSVATPTGRLWSHADGDFAIRVGGEVMTVTAVSGATSPQTFTVTRSVNGVVKAQSSGAVVALDHPVCYVR